MPSQHDNVLRSSSFVDAGAEPVMDSRALRGGRFGDMNGYLGAC